MLLWRSIPSLNSRATRCDRVMDAPSSPDLLTLWEKGEGRRAGGRALALLAGESWQAVRDTALLSVGRRDALLLDLRERLFGSRFTGLTACPSCRGEVELTFGATDVRRESAEMPIATALVEGIDVEFRVPNGSDLVAIESAGDIATARAMLLARCVTQAAREGEPVASDGLPVPVVEAITARMAELDPQADVTIDVDCPWCNHGWREPFDIVTFLWNELSARARRIFGDVHLFASAYGWSESEILQLTPARREAYLEMLR
jgi:hypothetical protein